MIRLWKQYSAAGGETIEMVLCDLKVSCFVRFTLNTYSLSFLNTVKSDTLCVFIILQGGKIHATVKKELVSRFSPFLIQGESLMLISFSVTRSCGSYRTTNHPYRIKLPVHDLCSIVWEIAWGFSRFRASEVHRSARWNSKPRLHGWYVLVTFWILKTVCISRCDNSFYVLFLQMLSARLLK